MRVYYDRDADVNLIKDKSRDHRLRQSGHAHANNLKDSGVTEVVVGSRGSTAFPRRRTPG